MSLQEFEREQLTDNERRYIQMRSIKDIGMGILWFGMGIFFIFFKKFGFPFESRLDDVTLRVVGCIFMLYGAFRVYRGIKKNYLRER